MTDYNAPLYPCPQDNWTRETCERLVKRVASDGLGTPYPFPGFIGSANSIPPAYGPIRYNGGCIRAGEWWQGEDRPLPRVPDDFEIIYVRTWGWRIRKKGAE